MTHATPDVLMPGVDVISLSETSWRVENKTGHDRGLLPLVGFVENIGDTYQVTALGAPLIRTYFGTLELAVNFLTSQARLTSVE